MSRQLATFSLIAIFAFGTVQSAFAAEPVANNSTRSLSDFVLKNCVVCHGAELPEGKLDVSLLSTELKSADIRNRWILIHDRVRDREMPPDADDLEPAERAEFLKYLSNAIQKADLAEVAEQGRGPIRRLNRDEYQQNLRDFLSLPHLDIRDMLPEDRESYHFNKTTETLDISRVQLIAYLDAAEAALCQAMASGIQPPAKTKYRAVGAKLFPSKATFGNRQAMFFAKDSKGIDNKQLDEAPDDPRIEMALFRSAHWPYYGYPQGFVARLPGEYRVRFSARAVLNSRTSC